MSIFYRVLTLLSVAVMVPVVGPAVWSAPGEPVTAANADPAWFTGRTKPPKPTKKDRERPYPKDRYVEPGKYWNSSDPLDALPDMPVEPNTSQVDEWQAAVAGGSASQETGFRLALAYARAHQFGAALKILDAQAIGYPGAYPVLTLRAAIYARLGRDDLAMLDLQLANDWQLAYHLGSDDFSWKFIHSDQENFINAALAESYARTGKLKGKTPYEGAIGYLGRAKNYFAQTNRPMDNHGLIAAIRRAEGVVQAAQMELDPTAVAAMNAAITPLPMECVATTTLEQAYTTGYRKAEAGPRLLEVHELCGAFDKAAALRASDPALATAKPFATRMWKVLCTDKPANLHAALDAGYQVYWVGQRIARFYMGCNKPEAAMEPASKALDAFSVVKHYKTRSDLDPVLELHKIKAGIYVSRGDYYRAASDLSAAMAQVNVLDEADSASYTSWLNDFATMVRRARAAGPPADVDIGELVLSNYEKEVAGYTHKRQALIEQKEQTRIAQQAQCTKIDQAGARIFSEVQSVTAMTTEHQYVGYWSHASASLRGMIPSARNNNCSSQLITSLEGSASIACGNAAEKAAWWKRMYNETIEYSCY
jgi:tetratricopeptide (TPR) repeat protein